jgi:hypothetical protein
MFKTQIRLNQISRLSEKRKESLRARLRKNIKLDGDCWIWTQVLHEKGYGHFYFRGVILFVHRVSYILHVGPLPSWKEMQLDHLCRNRACINPAHLELVTCRENLLRGETSTAERAARTICIHGHPLTSGNVRLNTQGHRRCKTCDILRGRIYYAKIRQRRIEAARG